MPKSPLSRAEVWVPLVACVAFLPAVWAGFVYDDTLLITDNAYVQEFDHWRRSFSTHFWDVSGMTPRAEPMRYYRPLVTLSYLLTWVALPGQAWAFHLTNVLLHALSTLLVLVIGRRFTRSPVLGTACALLFALHPSRTEAVIWISGRPDPLMTLFLLLTVELAYLGRDRRWRMPAALGVAVCFVLALLCKEPALAAPLLLCVDALDASPEHRRWHAGMIGLTAALGAGYSLLRHFFLPIDSPPLSWTPAHALVTVAHYAQRVVIPWPLTFFYRPEQLGPAGPLHSALDLTLGGLVVLGTLALGLYAVRRDRAAFVLLLGSAALLGPLLNLFYTGSKFTTADRFLYLPLWLLALGLGRLFAASLGPLLLSGTARWAGAGVLLAFAALNTSRALDLASSQTLWNAELALNPDNPVALRGRAGASGAEGKRALAALDLERSLRRESLRFHTLVTPDYDTDAYGRLIGLRAQALPDGADGALRQLAADAVDRLAARRRPKRSLGIDWPSDERSARWAALEGEAILARHLIPLTTRLDLRGISSALLDAIPDVQLHLAPNPPLIAIGEAREERFDRARRRVETMKRRRALMPKVVTPEAIADVEVRLQSAEQDFARAALAAESEGHFLRMRAFATLGAYGRAIVEARHVSRNQPDFLPLYVQLLVFARLEGAALDTASRALGPERARMTLDAIRQHLPAELRALPAL